MSCHSSKTLQRCSYKESGHCIIQLNIGETKKTPEESKIGLYVKASSRACIIQCDGGLYPRSSGEKKCDYLIKTENAFYLVELKSSNIGQAMRQFLSTLNLINRDHPHFLSSHLIKCFVVSNNSLSISKEDSAYKKLQRYLVNINKEKSDPYIQPIQIVPKGHKSSQKKGKIIVSPQNPLAL